MRRAREAENERDIKEGMTRRYLAVAADERAYAAVNLARALALPPGVLAKLRV